MKKVILFVLLFSPLFAHAQIGNLFDAMDWILFFINDVIVPLVFAVAILFFIWNAVRFFIFEGANSEGRDKAKKLAIYAIMALVLMVSIWGMVNLLTSALGFGYRVDVCPDYMPFCTSSTSYREPTFDLYEGVDPDWYNGDF